MRCKKVTTLLVSSLLGLTASAAIAGGPDKMEPPRTGFYIDGNVGYASRDWGSSIASTVNQGGFSWDNKTGGFAGGIDFGYQFVPFAAAEMGWMYLPQMKLSDFGLLLASMSNFMAYVGAKLIYPITPTFSIFGKGGPVYVYNYNSAPATNNSAFVGTNNSYWSGFVALGLQYYYVDHFYYMFQAGYIPGRGGNASRFSVPYTFYYLGSIGYMF